MRILKEFLSGDLELFAVPLLRFEITNALWKAISRGRTRLSDAQAVLHEFEAFNLRKREVAPQEILSTVRTYSCSAYNASYLALAKSEKISLVTTDKHSYNAVKDKSRLVLWVEDFK
ncbi:type II toxin-antitoxin system VapC family toxin [Candidatus Bipolaricaulota bacterium]|nr:type II toxin-antitoxin system VapC family toxin [Candidatus Bipolaricaulota bacterium]